MNRFPTVLCVALGLLALSAGAPVSGQTPFVEEAIERGLIYHPNDGTIAPWGWGHAFADLDQDGDADLVATGAAGGVVGVFENDGTGHFTDRSVSSAIPPIANVCAVIAGDFDNDLDLDLYLIVWHGQNRLFRNNGDLTFTNVTAFAGVGDSGAGIGSAWADYDGDGHLDLYLANHTGDAGSTQPNRLYRNLGTGQFADVAPALGVDNDYSTFQAVWFDFNRDGHSDLYLSNGKGTAVTYRENNLYENTGFGSFIDRSFTAGTAAYIDSMGVGVGDFDGNHHMDLYCTNVPFGNPLFLNQADGTFTEESGVWSMSAFRFGWGAQFFDFDNDTHLDLHVCNWFSDDLLYHNLGTAPAVEIAGTMGLVPEASHSTASSAADIDGDGDIDLVVQAQLEPLRLFVNYEGQARNWFRVKLRNEVGGNLHAIGATIDVTFDGITRTREVRAGESYKGQNELTQTFGLGAARQVDEVRVLWPGGSLVTYTGVEFNINDTVILSPYGIVERDFVRGDANGDQEVQVSDVVNTLGHLFLDGPVICREAMDANDDGSLAISDPVYLLAYLFGLGAPPPSPFSACGPDATPDVGGNLGCATSPCP